MYEYWSRSSFLVRQFYCYRSKMKQIGREDEVEKINRQALRIARQVADKTGRLMAGSLCNNTMYDPNNGQIQDEMRAMFKVQLKTKHWSGGHIIEHKVSMTTTTDSILKTS